MKLAWVTYLGALSSINAILILRISAHLQILAQCKVHRPRALFREGTVYVTVYVQWRIQDLMEGGARLIARKARVQKFFSHTEKTLTTPIIYAFWLTVLGLVAMRKRCLRSEF